jgi:hypothetical protein
VIFTESDTHGPTPNVVMAGFIGTPSQWERFDKRLPHGFSVFHSAELKSRRGDFAGWTDDQARALINDLVALVRDKLTFNAPMRKPCFLIGGQPNSLGGIFTVRQKPINLAERFQLKTWIYGALGGRRRC